MGSGKEDLIDWDRQYVWHPFTQMEDWLQKEPLVIERGEGAYLSDIHGNRYLDGVSSLWVTVHGHNHPRINEAIKSQLHRIAHSTLLGLSNIPSIQLAKRLIEIAPEGLTKVFYSDNGSTAVEIALKMAFQYWQQRKPDSEVPEPKKKTKFASLQEAYHGDTLGSVSVGGIDLFHRIYHPLLLEGFQIPNPYHYAKTQDLSWKDCALACAATGREILSKHHSQIAGLVIEPRIQGAGGMLKMPEGYLKHLREICAELNILFIADEVATGFGRTGKMFACNHENVSPDFLCLAKGMSGGYLPLAATLTTEKIYQGFLGNVKDLKTFFHGHTFTGNPLACAAALANLELFEVEGFWPGLQKKIDIFSKALSALNFLPHVKEVRQEGMMVGIELIKDKEKNLAYSYEEQVGARVSLACRQKGLILRPLGNVLVLMPPLCILEEDLKRMVQIVHSVLREILP